MEVEQNLGRLANDLQAILTKLSATDIVNVSHLENGITDRNGIPVAERGVCDGMPKRLKERIQVGTDQNGKPEYKWASGWSVDELHKDIARIIVEAGLLQDVAPIPKQEKQVITVEEFIKETYIPTFTPKLAPKTRANYMQYMRLNIIPFMGDMPMDQVTVATIQQFYNWMATAGERGRKKNLNAKSIERIGGLASRLFRIALEMKIINDSPFKKTLLSINSEEAGHHEALPDDLVVQIKQRIPFLENRDERVYMGLLVYTGMRTEEVRGLCWENVHLDQQYGVIVKAVTYPDNNKAFVGKAKTDRSNRTVLLPKPLVDILRPEERESGYICGGEQPWCYSKSERVSNRAFKHLEIKGYTDYDFRVTLGTQLKEGGSTSAQVADVLGHADTRMVETVYAKTRHNSVMKMLDSVENLTQTI